MAPLTILKENKADKLVLVISGTLDHRSDLLKLIGPLDKETHVYCKGLSRINSSGIRAWIRFFQLYESGVPVIKLFECSVSVVEQMNLIMNFAQHLKVESICLPFVCDNCKAELIGIESTEALKKVIPSIPSLKCTKCGGKAIFDDIPDEYFTFMTRRARKKAVAVKTGS